MKNLVSTLIFSLVILVSCNKDTAQKQVSPDCTDVILTQFNMIPYDGNMDQCKSYLRLYTFEGDFHYEFDNPCADMMSYFMDCNGDNICVSTNADICQSFFENRIEIGLVGISE